MPVWSYFQTPIHLATFDPDPRHAPLQGAGFTDDATGGGASGAATGYRHEPLRGSDREKSVFECMLEPDEVEGLAARLQREIGETSGNVRIYRLCASCLEAALGIGEIKSTVDEQNCVVL